MIYLWLASVNCFGLNISSSENILTNSTPINGEKNNDFPTWVTGEMYVQVSQFFEIMETL